MSNFSAQRAGCPPVPIPSPPPYPRYGPEWNIIGVELCPNAHWHELLTRLLRESGRAHPENSLKHVRLGRQLLARVLMDDGVTDGVNDVHTIKRKFSGASVSTHAGWLILPGYEMPISTLLFNTHPSWNALKDAHREATGLPPALLEHPKIMPILAHNKKKDWGWSEIVLPSHARTDLRTYLSRHPQADKHGLIIQVAEALEYLHRQARIPYGGLLPRWVHVNNSGGVELHPPYLVYEYHDSNMWPEAGETLPYSAPEIVLASGDGPREKRQWTPESDMYAFGMLVYTILSGREPWENAKLVDIFRRIVTGQMLPRPEDGTIDNSMWILCTACWNQNPADRPGIANVLAGLRSEVPPTYWRPDSVAGIDRWPGPSLGGRTGNANPTEIEVKIDGSVKMISLPKQKSLAGGFGTVMRGYTYNEGVIQVYAVKICRGKSIMPREYEIWKSLSHHSILPLLGVVDTNLLGEPARIFVSEYHMKGNLVEHLKSDTSRGSHILQLMFQVARGLEYLHNDKRIVHGDIKPENILITNHDFAVLADFGLSTYVAPSRRETLIGVRQVYTMAYGAPEILDDMAEYPSAPGRKRSKTTMSDMFAYGLLLYQTYAGGLGESQRDRIKLMVDMYDGRFPPRPVGREPVLCDDLWSICKRCWAKAPFLRPNIATVVEELDSLVHDWYRQEICEAMETRNAEQCPWRTVDGLFDENVGHWTGYADTRFQRE